MEFAESILFCLAAYFAIGAVVALLFVTIGVARVDLAAKGASFLFRPTIFFGCALLWPYIILRWLSGKRINQPNEGD